MIKYDKINNDMQVNQCIFSTEAYTFSIAAEGSIWKTMNSQNISVY
jgi:hypothetical protein